MLSIKQKDLILCYLLQLRINFTQTERHNDVFFYQYA
jgi:hypothetical protein